MMQKDIQEILYTEKQVQDKVRELGSIIEKDYKDKELVLLGLLNGSVIFLADLVRAINLPLKFDFMIVSSYGKSSQSSGCVDIIKDIRLDITNKDVLIVEDIIDTGLTLECVKKFLQLKQPKSIKTCAFLDKKECRKANIDADYVGFVVPDEFIVGYGLDYAQKYRNLPYVGVLKKSVY